VLEIDPEHANRYYEKRGSVKATIKDQNGAIADYTLAIALSPNVEVYNNKGLAKVLTGKNNSGCMDLKKAGELGFRETFNAIKKYCK
jgi:hypothetical protein